MRFWPSPFFLTLLVPGAIAVADPTVASTVVAGNLVLAPPAAGAVAAPGSSRVEPNEIFVSPDGRHLAFFVQGDGGRHAVIDGVAGPTFQTVSEAAWSPASLTFDFIGQSGKNFRIVRQNQVSAAGPAQSSPIKALAVTDPLPDSLGASNLVAAWKTGANYGVFRGLAQIGTLTYRDVGANCLQPGGTMVYSVVTGLDGALTLVRDTVSLGPPSTFGGAPFTPVWSSNGSHCAYVANTGKTDLLVVDEKGICALKGRPTLSWSPNGRRLAMWGPDVPYVVFDIDTSGQSSLSYNSGIPIFGDPVWSADSNHFAFYSPGKGEVIEDGKIVATGATFDFTGHVLTGPDAAWERELRHTRLALSADGKHVVYTVAASQPVSQPAGQGAILQHVQVVGGKAGPEQGNVYGLKFGDDGQTPLYLARNQQMGLANWTIVLGTRRALLWAGKPSGPSKPISPIISLGHDKYCVYGIDGEEIVRCEVTF